MPGEMLTMHPSYLSTEQSLSSPRHCGYRLFHHGSLCRLECYLSHTEHHQGEACCAEIIQEDEMDVNYLITAQ